MRKIELGNSEIVVQKLKEHDGVMWSGVLRNEIGVDETTFMGYLDTLKRAGLIRFNVLFLYKDRFHITLIKHPIP